MTVEKCPNCGFVPAEPIAGPAPWMEYHKDDRYHVAGCVCRYCSTRDAARAARKEKALTKTASRG